MTLGCILCLLRALAPPSTGGHPSQAAVREVGKWMNPFQEPEKQGAAGIVAHLKLGVLPKQGENHCRAGPVALRAYSKADGHHCSQVLHGRLRSLFLT